MFADWRYTIWRLVKHYLRHCQWGRAVLKLATCNGSYELQNLTLNFMDSTDWMEEQWWIEQIGWISFTGHHVRYKWDFGFNIYLIFIFCCKFLLWTESKTFLVLTFHFSFCSSLMILTFMRAWNKVGRYSNSRMYDSIFFNVL